MTDTVEPGAHPPAETEVAPRPPAGSGGGVSGRDVRREGGSNVAGWILASVGALFLACAIALAIVHLTQRGADGYYTSDTASVRSHGYAVTSEGLHFGDLPSFATNAVGQVRVSATSRNAQPLFVGIAPESAVNGYLGGVARNVVNEFDGSTVQSTAHAGRAPSGVPSSQGFWKASGSGRGKVNVTWKIKGGNWAVVVMNASARPQVSAGVSLGAKTNLVLWIGLGFLVLALLAGGSGGAMLWSSRRR